MPERPNDVSPLEAPFLYAPDADELPEPLTDDSQTVEGAGVEGETTPATPPPLPHFLVSRLTLESLDSPYGAAQPAPIHWAVGWADLMMTMFVLFLVLYLYPTAQRAQLALPDQAAQGVAAPAQQGAGQDQAGGEAKGQSTASGQGQAGEGKGGVAADQAQGEALAQSSLHDLTKLIIDDKEFGRLAEIDLTPERTVRIILAADLLFPSGNADLSPGAKENIKKIAEALKTTPYRINVVGHTDDRPIRGGPFATNWELSVMRATVVTRFLIEELGLPAPQFSVSGQSFYQPQANNDSEANRAKNRRVEIIVSRDPPPSLPVSANPALLH